MTFSSTQLKTVPTKWHYCREHAKLVKNVCWSSKVPVVCFENVVSGILFINYLIDGIISTVTQYSTGMGAGTLEIKGLKVRKSVPHSPKFKKNVQMLEKWLDVALWSSCHGGDQFDSMILEILSSLNDSVNWIFDVKINMDEQNAGRKKGVVKYNMKVTEWATVLQRRIWWCSGP